MANTGIEPGGNHSLTVGAVLGALLKTLPYGDALAYDVDPIVDNGDYTNAILLTNKASGNRYIVEVTPQEKV
jgi:hypothetical protein